MEINVQDKREAQLIRFLYVQDKREAQLIRATWLSRRETRRPLNWLNWQNWLDWQN